MIADSHATARAFARRAEYAERQVLDGKIGVPICRNQPGPTIGIVRLVDRRQAHGSFALAKPDQQES
jgi:hypothetical protein